MYNIKKNPDGTFSVEAYGEPNRFNLSTYGQAIQFAEHLEMSIGHTRLHLESLEEMLLATKPVVAEFLLARLKKLQASAAIFTKTGNGDVHDAEIAQIKERLSRWGILTTGEVSLF